MKRRWVWLCVLGVGCEPMREVVFEPLTVTAEGPLRVDESAGVVDLLLRLSAPAAHDVVMGYRLIGIEAQNGCPVADFEAAEGRVVWPPGSTEASVRLWIRDDDLAELDERLALVLDPIDGLPQSSGAHFELSIADDDRTGIIHASDFGVLPGRASDQSADLGRALDAAADQGRGVVVMAPGDYEIASVEVRPGTTLSARGVRWRRPPASPEDRITLSIAHQGSAASAATLVEGLAIDGRREQQGPYRDHERQEAHLIRLQGDWAGGGRVRATLEQLSLFSGTGSGVVVGPDADVTVCALSASELWRDAVTVIGGATRVLLSGVEAAATEGTGLWIGPRAPGFEGSLATEVDLEDVQVGAGDVEIEAASGSRVTVQRLTMTQAPLRLDAPGGSVRISDSVLMLGLASPEHDYWGSPDDVQIVNSTLVATESSEEAVTEADRSFSAVTLRAESLAEGTPASGGGLLVFDGCRFELGADVEPSDVVHAIGGDAAGVAVEVRGGSLATGYAGWFSPDCTSCTRTP